MAKDENGNDFLDGVHETIYNSLHGIKPKPKQNWFKKSEPAQEQEFQPEPPRENYRASIVQEQIRRDNRIYFQSPYNNASKYFANSKAKREGEERKANGQKIKDKGKLQKRINNDDINQGENLDRSIGIFQNALDKGSNFFDRVHAKQERRDVKETYKGFKNEFRQDKIISNNKNVYQKPLDKGNKFFEKVSARKQKEDFKETYRGFKNEFRQDKRDVRETYKGFKAELKRDNRINGEPLISENDDPWGRIDPYESYKRGQNPQTEFRSDRINVKDPYTKPFGGHDTADSYMGNYGNSMSKSVWQNQTDSKHKGGRTSFMQYGIEHESDLISDFNQIRGLDAKTPDQLVMDRSAYAKENFSKVKDENDNYRVAETSKKAKGYGGVFDAYDENARHVVEAKTMSYGSGFKTHPEHMIQAAHYANAMNQNGAGAVTDYSVISKAPKNFIDLLQLSKSGDFKSTYGEFGNTRITSGKVGDSLYNSVGEHVAESWSRINNWTPNTTDKKIKGNPYDKII